MKGEGREGCSCFVWSNGVWFHLFKNISWDISSKKSWSPIMLPPNTLEIVSVGDAQITKAGSCGIGGPFFIDEWWVKFPWAAMALPLLDVGFRFAWGWWGFEHGGVVIKCYVLFDSNKDEHFFKSQSISIPPKKQQTTNMNFAAFLPWTYIFLKQVAESKVSQKTFRHHLHLHRILHQFTSVSHGPLHVDACDVYVPWKRAVFFSKEMLA